MKSIPGPTMQSVASVIKDHRRGGIPHNQLSKPLDGYFTIYTEKQTAISLHYADGKQHTFFSFTQTADGNISFIIHLATKLTNTHLCGTLFEPYFTLVILVHIIYFIWIYF
eukprot:921330_1